MAKEKEQPWVSELTDAVIAEIIRRLTKDMKLDSKEFGKHVANCAKKQPSEKTTAGMIRGKDILSGPISGIQLKKSQLVKKPKHGN
jgi:hypothetical protein